MIKYVVLSHKGKDGGSIDDDNTSIATTSWDGGSIDDD